MNPARTRLEAGDALRAVAALSVLLYHAAFVSATVVQPRFPWFEDAYGRTAGRVLGHLELGLYVFFALSGYLIARPFVAAVAAGESTPDIKRYLVRRFARIAPAFWVVAAIALIWHGTYGANTGQVAAQFAFGQNYLPAVLQLQSIIGQGWTLDVELLFYILVPIAGLLAIAALTRRPNVTTRATGIIAACAAVLVASLVLRAVFPETFTWQRSLPAMLFAFMPGVALAAAEQVLPARLHGKDRSGRLLALGLLAAAAACAVVYMLLHPRIAYPPRFGAAPAAFAAATAGLLLAAVLVRQWTGLKSWSLLDNGISRWIGARSYSVYLTHALVIEWVAERGGLPDGPKARFVVIAAISVVLTLAVSALLYRLVELPAQRAAHRRRSSTVSA